MIDVGTGPALVLIPGVQGRWEWLAPAVDALARTRRVISFSLCGARDTRRAFDRSRQFDSFVDQIDEVLDRARLETAAIVGHSFGGLVALRYAAQRPDRVTALLLVSTPAPSWRPDDGLRKQMAAPYLALPGFVAGSPGRLWPEIAAAHATFGSRVRFSASHLARVLRAPFSPRQMRDRLAAVDQVDLVADCASVRVRTLIVTGEAALDRVVPVSGAREFLRLIAGSRWATLERTGHLGLVTRPQEFAKMVQEFLR
jgi:pimeloyl-ACP methyl ester carboxylesterase